MAGLTLGSVSRIHSGRPTADVLPDDEVVRGGRLHPRRANRVGRVTAAIDDESREAGDTGDPALLVQLIARGES